MIDIITKFQGNLYFANQLYTWSNVIFSVCGTNFFKKTEIGYEIKNCCLLTCRINLDNIFSIL